MPTVLVGNFAICNQGYCENVGVAMTDRELLELAAKAAGINFDRSPYNGGGLNNTGFDLIGNAVLDWHNNETWNPLTDDGDALRLMVDKRFTVKVDGHEVEVFDEWGECLVSIGMQADEDYHAATRRAIVRAAAAIGQGME